MSDEDTHAVQELIRLQGEAIGVVRVHAEDLRESRRALDRAMEIAAAERARADDERASARKERREERREDRKAIDGLRGELRGLHADLQTAVRSAARCDVTETTVADHGKKLSDINGRVIGMSIGISLVITIGGFVLSVVGAGS